MRRRLVEFYDNWMITILLIALVLTIAGAHGPDWLMIIALVMVAPGFLYMFGSLLLAEWRSALDRRGEGKND